MFLHSKLLWTVLFSLTCCGPSHGEDKLPPVLKTAPPPHVARKNASASNGAAPKPLTPEQARQKNLDECLARYYIKHVDADTLRPWSIMHGLLAFGQDALIRSRGQRVKAMDYLCSNGLGDDRQLLALVNEKITPRTGRGLQGHAGQLLAMLAQSEVPIDHPIKIGDKPFTIRDLVEHEKRTCRTGSELTFQLIGLSYYLDSDAVWKNDLGESWNISRLIYEEMAQPINGAACGGVHRLMGLSFALQQRRREGKPINQQWARIENFVARYQDQAFRLQNPDGSFSTNWFEGTGPALTTDRKIYTTGHLFEWLAYSLPDERLQSPEMGRAADALLLALLTRENQKKELGGLDVGPKCHAIRGLRLYQERLLDQSTDYTRLAHLDETPPIPPEKLFALQQQTPKQTTRTGLPHSAQTVAFQASQQGPPIRRRRFRRRR